MELKDKVSRHCQEKEVTIASREIQFLCGNVRVSCDFRYRVFLALEHDVNDVGFGVGFIDAASEGVWDD